MKNQKITFLTLAILMLATITSCSEDDAKAACESNNTGDLIITNNYNESANSNNSLIVFIDRTPTASNSPGDVSIPPGQVGTITIAAGVHSVIVYLNTGSCSETRCLVSRELLGERDVDLEQCEELNLAYGA